MLLFLWWSFATNDHSVVAHCYYLFFSIIIVLHSLSSNIYVSIWNLPTLFMLDDFLLNGEFCNERACLYISIYVDQVASVIQLNSDNSKFYKKGISQKINAICLKVAVCFLLLSNYSMFECVTKSVTHESHIYYTIFLIRLVILFRCECYLNSDGISMKIGTGPSSCNTMWKPAWSDFHRNDRYKVNN